LYALAQRLSHAAAFCWHVIFLASAGPAEDRSVTDAMLASASVEMMNFRISVLLSVSPLRCAHNGRASTPPRPPIG
jgi:hypothetical protein